MVLVIKSVDRLLPVHPWLEYFLLVSLQVVVTDCFFPVKQWFGAPVL